MTLLQELTAIVENEQDVIPFLKALDKKQKKELQPGLKKLQKHYADYIQKETGGSYSLRGTQGQNQILSISSFVCSNQKDFEQSFSFSIVNREKLTPILAWYCPEWFSDHVNKGAQQDFTSFDYEWYLDLTDNGFVQLNEEMIAKILPAYIFSQNKKTWKYIYKPERLLKRPAILEEHLWYLFDFETNLHAAENYKNFDDGSVPGRWMDAIKRYMNKGKLNRERLLKGSITSANKNFNQSSSNWFMDLFMFLEPSKEELLQLQNELLNTFNSPNSKPYNQVLKLFKDLCTEPGFAIASFMDHVPLVLTAESKTGVSSALMVLDKLAKKYPAEQEQACIVACQAFIHQDNALQVRAAKLLQKHGDPNSEAINNAIQSYYQSLLSEARGILSGFSASFVNEEELIEEDITDAAAHFAEIRMPQDFDEFVFLASQAFDQNEAYHFDLLAASALKFQNEMTAGNILKLMPAFQRAYKMATSEWSSTVGYLDNMLTKFLISYGQLLISFDGIAAAPIIKMHQSFVRSEDEKKTKWSSYKPIFLGGIKAWDVYTHSTGYKLHKGILLNTFFMLERKIALPLLSTPTHEPCRVSVITLIERLARYRQANTIPGDMDAQVAVARCLVEDKAEALQLVNKTLSGEGRDLIGFILGETHHPQNNYKLKPAWLVAAAIRYSPNIGQEWLALTGLPENYLTGEFAWESMVEDYTYKQYDHQLRKEIDVPNKRKVIKIHFGAKQKKVSALKSILGKILPEQSKTETSIYDNIELKYQYVSAEHNDIKRLLYLNPQQPEIWLAHVIDNALIYSDFLGENDKRLVTYTLEVLLTLNYSYGTMAHLLIATCMISSDKTIRTYAAELWIKGVREGNIDSAAIGKIIGQHERIEFAPLKRFTDLAISNMFQISPKHNHALENLLSACIQQMNDTPINGCKKLLEIYAEILSINKAKVTNGYMTNRLNAWSTTETLKKVVQKILNM